MHGRRLILPLLFMPFFRVSATVQQAGAGTPSGDSTVVAKAKTAEHSVDVFEAQLQAYAENKGRFYMPKLDVRR
jgi:hypothetical protein